MFANYVFLLLNKDGNNEITAEEYGIVSNADDEIAQYELMAAMAIGGESKLLLLI